MIQSHQRTIKTLNSLDLLFTLESRKKIQMSYVLLGSPRSSPLAINLASIYEITKHLTVFLSILVHIPSLLQPC